jgi:hypothetical protein
MTHWDWTSNRVQEGLAAGEITVEAFEGAAEPRNFELLFERRPPRPRWAPHGSFDDQPIGPRS